MKALLIPTATIVPENMRGKFGNLPTVLFPLGNKTMLQLIYEQYKTLVDKVYVVVYQKRHLIEDFIKRLKLPIEIIELDEIRDLGYSIAKGITHILNQNADIEYLYINFGDSLAENILDDSNDNIAYFASDLEPDSWTYFTFNEGKFSKILDKNEENFEEVINEYKNVFIGIFGINQPKEFLALLKEKNIYNIDSFYKAIFNYSREHKFLLLNSSDWIDVGHLKTYNRATTKVAARSFNTIEIDEERGILTKKSDNKEKLVQEIKWYLKLPNELQYLIPRIYTYSLDIEDPYVKMEYYGYQTLHECLVHGELSLIRWQNIFKKLFLILGDMSKYKVLDEFGKPLIKDIKKIYVEKTVSRLLKIKDTTEFGNFFVDKIIINSKVYRSLEEYLSILPELIDKYVISTFIGEFNIIHGDLCFSNILVEDSYNFMRLIDPRGSFGEWDIYGDTRYEIAKLFHSLEGKYDLMIEDMFDIEVRGNEINYNWHKNFDSIFEVFKDVFSMMLTDINSIRLIEATLFLSMIPLHSDYNNRQFMMLARGCELLEDVLEVFEKEMIYREK